MKASDWRIKSRGRVTYFLWSHAGCLLHSLPATSRAGADQQNGSVFCLLYYTFWTGVPGACSKAQPVFDNTDYLYTNREAELNQSHLQWQFAWNSWASLGSSRGPWLRRGYRQRVGRTGGGHPSAREQCSMKGVRVMVLTPFNAYHGQCNYQTLNVTVIQGRMGNGLTVGSECCGNCSQASKSLEILMFACLQNYDKQCSDVKPLDCTHESHSQLDRLGRQVGRYVGSVAH